MITEPVLGWWFCPEDRRLRNGDGRLVEVGAVHEHAGPLVPCKSGLHGSESILDALLYAPGSVLCRTRHSGEIVRAGDKLVSARREYLAVVDATEMLREFARWCALQVTDTWDPPAVVVYWLLSGDEDARKAVRCAAYTAACSGRRAASVRIFAAAASSTSAVYAAAYASSAAYAVRAAQRETLEQMAQELITGPPDRWRVR